MSDVQEVHGSYQHKPDQLLPRSDELQTYEDVKEARRAATLQKGKQKVSSGSTGSGLSTAAVSTEDEIRNLAYALWRSGFSKDPVVNWLEAQARLLKY